MKYKLIPYIIMPFIYITYFISGAMGAIDILISKFRRIK